MLATTLFRNSVHHIPLFFGNWTRVQTVKNLSSSRVCIETGLLFYHKDAAVVMVLTFTHFGSKLGIGAAAHGGLSLNKSVQQLISVNQ